MDRTLAGLSHIILIRWKFQGPSIMYMVCLFENGVRVLHKIKMVTVEGDDDNIAHHDFHWAKNVVQWQIHIS